MSSDLASVWAFAALQSIGVDARCCHETGRARHRTRVGFTLSVLLAVLAASVAPSVAQDSTTPVPVPAQTGEPEQDETSSPEPSNAAPMFVDGNTTMRRMHDETGVRAQVGDPVSATDADGDTLTYSLIGQDASSFSVDADGQISLGVALADSSRISYRFWVTVYDGKDSLGEVEATPVIDDIIFVTITVTSAQGEHVPSRDIGLSRNINSNPFGVWSDGETMWVADWIDDAVYAYKTCPPVRATLKKNSCWPRPTTALSGFGLMARPCG